jgi:glycogen(starch) synthase
MSKVFLKELSEISDKKIVAHFHEWMAGSSIAPIRRELPDIKVVFTTHATILGRYLAMNDNDFYNNLPYYNWEIESKKFNIYSQTQLERAAAHGAHVFTTVSEITGKECEYLLGRKVDLTLPNGLNIKRFTALHESQILHKKYKEKIHKFVMGHFFPSYSFDLDKTLYFFTSGRFEFQNKGYDLTLESLARLNWKLQKEKIDVTIVMFFVTKKPFYTINPKALQGRAMMQELKETCDDIKNQIGDRLFYQATLSADHRVPPLNDFMDEHLRLRYRRTVQSWKSSELPMVVTHTLKDPDHDEILEFLRASHLINNSFDRVKVVYHPDFISSINPLFHMDYDDFVRGCHLGIFPSRYEPWGYTPLECIARGIPTITSDLAGFGDYIVKNEQELLEEGVYVVDRTSKDFHQSADRLVDQMFNFINQDRKQRISQRTTLEMNSFKFDWSNLCQYYDNAYKRALTS